MSSRILSAYFDDFRKGKKQREELKFFLVDAIEKDPLRRGHLVAWMDQAQYEHPIPVTDFLLLRKEVEAALSDDDKTMLASTAPKRPTSSSPDAETLVAFDSEATIVAGETKPGHNDNTDLSSGSQASDMARLHDVPTLIGATAEDATLVKTSTEARAMTLNSVEKLHQHEATPTLTTFPKWIWLVALILVCALAIFYWGTRPLAPQLETTKQNFTQTNSTPPSTEPDIIEPTTEPPIAKPSLEKPSPKESSNDALAASNAQEIIQADSPRDEPNNQALPHDLSASQTLELLKQRADQGLLLPLNNPGNAQHVLNHMQLRFADHPDITMARLYLKQAYLKGSKQAQEQGDWDASQQLLDAAFDVLSPAKKN